MWPKDTPRPESNPFNFRYTIAKKDIPDFVNSLHKLQEHYLDAALDEKAREGYPEAMAVIDHIKGLK
jgi:hypothetical protein